MKVIQSFLIIAMSVLPQIVLAGYDEVEGKQLFNTYCSACHGITGGMDMSKRVAPPIVAVRMHYIGRYPDKASFVTAITSWLENQDASKTLMRGAIRRFKIMPPVPVAKNDAQKIAVYIYQGDIEKPAGFEKHIEEQHGKQGGGRGMGMF